MARGRTGERGAETGQTSVAPQRQRVLVAVVDGTASGMLDGHFHFRSFDEEVGSYGFVSNGYILVSHNHGIVVGTPDNMVDRCAEA